MFHASKTLFGLFLLVTVVHYTQATTVSNLLNELHQKQLSIQDYDFLVARSFHFKAFNEQELDTMVKNQYEKYFNTVSTENVDVEKMKVIFETVRESHARDKFTGAIFQSKGIGTTTQSYAIATSADPLDEQMTAIMNSSLEERQNSELYKIPTPKMKFGQHRLDLPNVIIDGHPASSLFVAGNARRPGDPFITLKDNIIGNGLFDFPSQSTVWVKDGKSQEVYRSSTFPFWHEEVLRYATVDNSTIVREGVDEIELLVNVGNAPLNLSFTVFCDRFGKVSSFIKKSNDKTQMIVDYFNFVELTDGIEVPQIGRMWMPASQMDSANPMQEWTRISTILNGTINMGLKIEDLYIDVSAGSVILDQRTGREAGTRIETTQTVRLGANLPENVNDLNQPQEAVETNSN